MGKRLSRDYVLIVWVGAAVSTTLACSQQGDQPRLGRTSDPAVAYGGGHTGGTGSSTGGYGGYGGTKTGLGGTTGAGGTGGCGTAGDCGGAGGQGGTCSDMACLAEEGNCACSSDCPPVGRCELVGCGGADAGTDGGSGAGGTKVGKGGSGYDGGTPGYGGSGGSTPALGGSGGVDASVAGNGGSGGKIADSGADGDSGTGGTKFDRSTGFDCPAGGKSLYNCGPKGCCRKCSGDQSANEDHFDCDDYALFCQMWCEAKHGNCCQIGYSGTSLKPGEPCKTKDCPNKVGGGACGHQINAAEFEPIPGETDPEYKEGKRRFCLVEPQRPGSRNSICCWYGTDIKSIPTNCVEKACTSINAKDCTVDEINCTSKPSPHAGEKPFYVHKKACDDVAAETGCTFNWIPGPEQPGQCVVEPKDLCPPEPPKGTPYPEPTCPCRFSSSAACGRRCAGLERATDEFRIEYCKAHPYP